ncbi:thiamine phosphate synthase [Rudaea sp.]|uniref:thiamine phosphate synthase n=1 Tax=Rudaea sp. TaxID=2136325 RepID=UPI002ED5E995
MHPHLTRRGLYAISDGPRPDLLSAVKAVLHGGAALLQYRDKTTDSARRAFEARALRELCARFEVPFIVNDDVELALAVAADGVHLGEDDSAVAAARARLGAGVIIGASCYDSLARARQLAAAGADYLAFGAFFSSPTKPNARRATLDLLSEAKPLGLPLVAIGGITPDNARPLVEAGADFLAAISGVFTQADPEVAARRYAALYKN